VLRLEKCKTKSETRAFLTRGREFVTNGYAPPALCRTIPCARLSPGKRSPDRARERTPGILMHSTFLALFLEISRTVVSMCSAGVLIFLVALWAAKADIARVRGLDKVVALSNLCFAAPLAVFGALHLADARSLAPMVPSYMPWRLFWAYFFGFALLAASLSMATRILVRWSGLLFGIAMFLFVAMMDVPGSLASPRDRFGWTLTIREMTFGCGGWVLAGNAMARSDGLGSRLITFGRVVIGVVSWSTGPNLTGGCGGLTGLTPLVRYRSWIVDTAKSLGSPLP